MDISFCQQILSEMQSKLRQSSGQNWSNPAHWPLFFLIFDCIFCQSNICCQIKISINNYGILFLHCPWYHQVEGLELRFLLYCYITKMHKKWGKSTMYMYPCTHANFHLILPLVQPFDYWAFSWQTDYIYTAVCTKCLSISNYRLSD